MKRCLLKPLLLFVILDSSLLASSPVEVRRAVLSVATERADSADKNGLTTYAANLRSEISAAQAGSAEAIAAQGAASPHLSVLRRPIATENNPYLTHLLAGARAALSRPDVDWPKLTTGADNYFVLQASSEYDTRGTAERMEAYFWLFANPASPLQGDPELLRRFLRRAHAYIDAIGMLHSSNKLKAGQNVLDDFAIAPASSVFREFVALYPGLLLPSQKQEWDQAMRLAADQMAKKAEGFNGTYANIDLSLSFELLNFGLYLNDEALLRKSRELFLAQKSNILPDGGTHYIRSQNESVGYHDVIAHFIARTYEVTSEPAALEMLRRLEWYGPVSVGRASEFWTAPSWKHQWNGASKATGGEPVIHLSKNPLLRGMLTPPQPSADLRHWAASRFGLSWWDPSISAEPLVDNFTIFDRNIEGPRAWYGTFNYAATLRNIPESEPGHATLVGAQVTTPEFKRGSILMGVYPRLVLGEDRANPRSFAWLTSGLKSDCLVRREWSAFYAEYQLHGFASSKKGKSVPWIGRQLWLTLPDRLIGFLEVAPRSAEAGSGVIEGLVRLGIGGTVIGPAQALIPTGPNRFSFGDLRVILHEHNYAEMKTESTPFRLKTAPFSDIVLKNSGALSEARNFVVEVRPASTTTEAVVEQLSTPTLGLRVTVGEKRFSIWANPGPAEVLVPLLPLTQKVSRHPQGAGNLLGGGKIMVQVESQTPEDHHPGWKDYAQMLAEKR